MVFMSPTRMFSDFAREGAGRHPRAEQVMGPNSEFLYRHTTPVSGVNNEGAIRDEIVIRTLNDNSFWGKLTRHEAKHCICKDILGCPFSNF
jgi:hypothetical protein